MRKTIYQTYHPPGFGTLNSYLVIDNPEKMIGFLKAALFAEELNRTVDEEKGVIQNCILRVGKSCLMVAQASDMLQHSPTSYYLYVADVDALFAHSLANGAEEVFPPGDMPYGDRQAGIKDPLGNYWWLSKRLKEEAYTDHK